jgi:hypothetical protein
MKDACSKRNWWNQSSKVILCSPVFNLETTAEVISNMIHAICNASERLQAETTPQSSRINTLGVDLSATLVGNLESLSQSLVREFQMSSSDVLCEEILASESIVGHTCSQADVAGASFRGDRMWSRIGCTIASRTHVNVVYREVRHIFDNIQAEHAQCPYEGRVVEYTSPLGLKAMVHTFFMSLPVECSFEGLCTHSTRKAIAGLRRGRPEQ